MSSWIQELLGYLLLFHRKEEACWEHWAMYFCLFDLVCEGGERNRKKVNICINKYAVRVLLIQSVAILILPSINWLDETQSFWGIWVLRCNGDVLDLVWYRLFQALLAAYEWTSHSFYVSGGLCSSYQALCHHSYLLDQHLCARVSVTETALSCLSSRFILT